MHAIRAVALRKSYRWYRSRVDRIKEGLCLGLRSYAEVVEALQGISFEVRKGEAVGMIGRNGSGKSTLLRVLAGISAPTAGLVEVQGTVAAMIELGDHFHPDYTGRENLEFTGLLLGLSRKVVQDRLPGVIDFAELGDRIDRPLRTYSTGMRARLAFAASTLITPDMLLVDEVLAVGDQYFVGKCVRYLQEVHRSGRTVVLVSHDLTLIRSLCQRVLWLDRGQVIADGPPGEVCAKYLRALQQDEHDRLLEANQALWALRMKVRQELAGTGDERVPDREQIQITRVQALDEHGVAKYCFLTGESLILRIHYRSSIIYDDPNVAVSIQRLDGVMITCHASKDARIATGRIEPGEGWFELVFPHLLLGAGTYWVHVAITVDEALAYGDTNFDRVERAQTFTVVARGRSYPVAVEHPVLWRREGRLLQPGDPSTDPLSEQHGRLR